MTDLAKSKEIHCPWCHNSLDIIRPGKRGMHYANQPKLPLHKHRDVIQESATDGAASFSNIISERSKV